MLNVAECKSFSMVEVMVFVGDLKEGEGGQKGCCRPVINVFLCRSMEVFSKAVGSHQSFFSG